MTTPPAVRVRGLSVRRQGRLVLRDVSLDVPSGAIVGLTGHNGAGKTTLLRVVLGELAPASGAVELFGRVRDRRSRGALRRRVAFAPQHPYASTTPVSVRTAVAFGRFPRVGVGRRLRAEDWSAVDAALRRFDLADLAAAAVTELSGGQAQRVNLARAFAAQPDLLLLDEPTSHLDAASLRVALRALEEHGGTVLLVTHGAGLGVCDVVHRLGGGRLLA